jgi:hypothetical protein
MNDFRKATKGMTLSDKGQKPAMRLPRDVLGNMHSNGFKVSRLQTMVGVIARHLII